MKQEFKLIDWYDRLRNRIFFVRVRRSCRCTPILISFCKDFLLNTSLNDIIMLLVSHESTDYCVDDYATFKNFKGIDWCWSKCRPKWGKLINNLLCLFPFFSRHAFLSACRFSRLGSLKCYYRIMSNFAI